MTPGGICAQSIRGAETWAALQVCNNVKWTSVVNLLVLGSLCFVDNQPHLDQFKILTLSYNYV